MVAMGAMFALGVLVGRRAERIEPARVKDPIAQIDADRAVHEQLTFYKTLTEGDSPQPRVEKPAAREPAPQAAKPPEQAETSSKERPAEVNAPATVAEAESEPTKIADPDATSETVSGDGAGANINDAIDRLQQRSAQLDAEPAEKFDRAFLQQLAKGPAKPGEYTVQVSAFQSEHEAEAYAAGLRRKGYQPFVVRTSLPGRGTWYRVRMGSFNTIESAREAKHHLAGAAIPAWVLRSE